MTFVSRAPSDQAGADPDPAADLSGDDLVNRRGGPLYFAASLISQVSALLRYVVLARLLGPEQLGLAATLVITASFFDMISDTGADRFLIQNRDGDTAEVQSLVQLVYAGRGALVAAALVLFALPLAQFYHTPRLAEGLAVLALSPFVLGFLHLDVRRAQRRHDFRPQAVCMIAAEVSGLLATVVAAWLTRDFTAILYGLITRAIVMVLVSHLRSHRAYRWGWDRGHAPALAHFAGPLMLNGLMLFLVSQGDRVIVGSQLGVRALGQYSAIMLLIYYPSALLASYIHAIYIPLIAAQRDRPLERNRVSDILGGQTLILALGMVVGFAIVAPALVPILFGDRFKQTGLLVGLIGVLQTARFLLNWPTTTALAMGRSTTVLLSNMAHLLAFAGAYVGMLWLGGLVGVVAGFSIGEVIAVAIALYLLDRNMERQALAGFDRLAAFTLVCGAVLGWTWALSAKSWPAMLALLVACVPVGVWLFRRESAVIAEGISAAKRLTATLFLRHNRR